MVRETPSMCVRSAAATVGKQSHTHHRFTRGDILYFAKASEKLHPTCMSADCRRGKDSVNHLIGFHESFGFNGFFKALTNLHKGSFHKL